MKRLKIIIIIIFTMYFNFVIYSQQNWIVLNSGISQTINSVQFINPNIGFIACSEGFIYKSNNGGINWSIIPSPTTINIAKIKFFDVNTGVIAGGGGIYRTTNLGAYWFHTDIERISDCVSADGNTMFACYSSPYGGEVKSTNNGESWSGLYPIGHTVLALFFINANTGYATSYNNSGGISYHYLNKTTTGGYNWAWVTSFTSQLGYGGTGDIFISGMDTGYYTSKNQSGKYINRFLGGNGISCPVEDFQVGLHFINGKTGWSAGENGSVYKTTNAGVNWNNCNTPVTSNLNDIFFINDQIGWAVGANGTILKTTNGGYVPVEQLSNSLPSRFSLYQNYPNPFNPSTKIKFDIPNSPFEGGKGDVKLIVYDVLGKEISVLVNQLLKPGTYEVEWDGSNFASGIYYYKLEASDFSETKRMVMIR
jgi:hypothetical protein